MAVTGSILVAIDNGKLIRPLPHLSIWQSAASWGGFHLPANENAPTIGQYCSPGYSLLLLDYGPEYDIDAEGKDVQEAANLIAEFEKALGHITVMVAYESLYKDKYTTVWALKTNIHPHAN